VLLSRDEAAELARLTTLFGGILNRAAAAAADRDQLVAWGFPRAFAELIVEEPVWPVIFGRFDFLLANDGSWQLVEYNSDTPSGLREAVAADEAAFALLGRRFTGERVNRELTARAIEPFLRELAGLPRPLRLGFLTDSYHLEDMAQMIFTERLVREHLADEGVHTVIGDIKNLDFSRGHPTLIGRRIDALYRYYPFEALLARPQFVVIVEAVARGRLRLLNGPRGLLLQNKGLMAWIWAHRVDPIFTPAEQAAIRDHLPATWWVRELPPDIDRPSLVIKQVFGREGEEVYLGDRMADEDWARVREWGTFVAQRRVATHPVAAVSWDWKGEPFAAERWPSVGSFAAFDEFAGVYTRLGSPILTSQAEFAPTFVEE
jgi:glutathionylspermidine synthase